MKNKSLSHPFAITAGIVLFVVAFGNVSFYWHTHPFISATYVAFALIIAYGNAKLSRYPLSSFTRTPLASFTIDMPIQVTFQIPKYLLGEWKQTQAYLYTPGRGFPETPEIVARISQAAIAGLVGAFPETIPDSPQLTKKVVEEAVAPVAQEFGTTVNVLITKSHVAPKPPKPKERTGIPLGGRRA